MTEAVTISFVVPAYNEAAHLAKTLEAIYEEIGRTGCSAEVVVVNNASTDATGEVAASFAGVILVDEPVKGLVQARRAGFMRASGGLIANIDADTIITRGWLARVLRDFARNPKLVALSGPYIYYDVSKPTRAAVRGFYWLGYMFYILNRFVLRTGSLLQGGNFAVRRTAMETIGGFNSQFSFYGEDTDLARRLSAVGSVRFTFRLPALSSGRRLASEGVMRMGLRYGMNYFWATFFHKPFTDEWIDVRTDP